MSAPRRITPGARARRALAVEAALAAALALVLVTGAAGLGVVAAICLPLLLLGLLWLAACSSQARYSEAFSGGYVGGTVVAECAPFARALSGVRLTGEAADWWWEADGRYARQHRPEEGSIFVLRRSDRLPDGHVAVVYPGLGAVKADRFFPNVIGGAMNPKARSDGSKTAGDVWNRTDRLRVKYYTRPRTRH